MTELEYSKEQFFNAHQAVLNAVNEKISLRDLILRCEMQVHAAKMWELEFRTRPDGVVGNRYERDPLIAAMEKIEPITTQFKPLVFLMYLWNVTCRMPPPPEEYPVTFNYVNACGHFLTKTITTEKQFYAWRFLQWGLQAQGESLVTREPKRSGEDSGLARGQT